LDTTRIPRDQVSLPNYFWQPRALISASAFHDDYNSFPAHNKLSKYGMASEMLTPAPEVASTDAQSEYGSDLDHDHLFPPDPSLSLLDNRSEYGSEFDTDGEQIIADLISGIERVPGKSLVLESIVEDDNRRSVAHLPKCGSQNSTWDGTSQERGVLDEGEIDVTRRTSHSTRKTHLDSQCRTG
jgi:hypothetical protein